MCSQSGAAPLPHWPIPPPVLYDAASTLLLSSLIHSNARCSSVLHAMHCTAQNAMEWPWLQCWSTAPSEATSLQLAILVVVSPSRPRCCTLSLSLHCPACIVCAPLRCAFLYSGMPNLLYLLFCSIWIEHTHTYKHRLANLCSGRVVCH